jgi:cellobiose-specific phosphotransferase system component IIC
MRKAHMSRQQLQSAYYAHPHVRDSLLPLTLSVCFLPTVCEGCRTISQPSTGWSAPYSVFVGDIKQAGILNGNTAIFGFTGATGSNHVLTQAVQNAVFSVPTPSSTPTPVSRSFNPLQPVIPATHRIHMAYRVNTPRGKLLIVLTWPSHHHSCFACRRSRRARRGLEAQLR